VARLRDLLSWGDEYYSANGPRRMFQHVRDAGIIAPDGACANLRQRCSTGRILLVLPGPAYDEARGRPPQQRPSAPHTAYSNPIRGH